MFFIRCGKVIAFFGFWGSVFQLGVALLIAFGAPTVAENSVAAQRYFSAANTGEIINTASWGLLLSVCIGILSEIGSRVIKLAKRADEYFESAEYFAEDEETAE